LDADRMVDSAGADAESPSKDRVSAIFDGFENDGSQDTSSNFDFGTDLDALFEPNAAAPKSRETAASPAEFDLDLDSMFAEPVATSNRSSAPTLELPSPFRDNVMEPGTVSVDVDDIPTAQVQKVSGKNALSDLPDFDADFAGLFESIDQPAGPGATSTDVKSATGSLSDWSLDALEDAVPSSDSLDSAAKSIPNAANRFAVEKVASQDFLSGGNWSLEDLTDGEPAKPAAPDSFGVEKVAAQDFLAPEGGDPKGFDFNSLPELDLVPLEDAVAPQINRPELVSEHRLDDAVVAPKAGGIRNVVVLGASIGGPEAVREFLAAIPARFPALFVLAQHMGAEFLDLMAAQLAKATKLTVRTPSHGERLSHGEVIVVPTTHRLLIDADGVVQLAQLPESSPYSPSIDLVLRDIADRFAATTTAIIFSGMAHDAIDGSKYLASKGGKVWVQDPDTCVISSMVDGAREAGVVTFIGAPAQLAQQTIASYAKA
ncbi:MAG: chemotaxis protein CheB, partial [Tahibacter sp.]